MPATENMQKQIDLYPLKVDAHDPMQIDDRVDTDYFQNPDDPLNAGIQAYQQTYADKIKKYYDGGISAKVKPWDTTVNPSQPTDDEQNNFTYFRRLYAEFIAKLNKNPAKKFPPINAELRETDPDAVVPDMEEFFGTQGVELYRLALEEEMNSYRFREAVYHKSMKFKPGKEWDERLAVFVGGPSASGKTVAAESSLDEAAIFMPTKEGGKDYNTVVEIDGALPREVSHVRKQAIIVANNLGYPGIKDLHERSEMLGKVKDCVYEHTLNHTSHSMVIPETFSGFFNPFSREFKLLNSLLSRKGIRTAFTHVVGADSKRFKQIVASNGSDRAWKKTGFDQVTDLDSFDINEVKVNESKKYGSLGFFWGWLGSILAEKWYKLNCDNSLILSVTNDLIFIKKPSLSLRSWIEVTEGVDVAEDEIVEKISARVFDFWLSSDYKLRGLSPKAYSSFMPIRKVDDNNNWAEVKWHLLLIEDETTQAAQISQAKAAGKIPLLIKISKAGVNDRFIIIGDREGKGKLEETEIRIDDEIRNLFLLPIPLIKDTLTPLSNEYYTQILLKKLSIGHAQQSIRPYVFESWQNGNKDEEIPLTPMEYGEKYKYKKFPPIIQTSYENKIENLKTEVLNNLILLSDELDGSDEETADKYNFLLFIYSSLKAMHPRDPASIEKLIDLLKPHIDEYEANHLGFRVNFNDKKDVIDAKSYQIIKKLQVNLAKHLDVLRYSSPNPFDQSLRTKIYSLSINFKENQLELLKKNLDELIALIPVDDPYFREHLVSLRDNLYSTDKKLVKQLLATLQQSFQIYEDIINATKINLKHYDSLVDEFEKQLKLSLRSNSLDINELKKEIEIRQKHLHAYRHYPFFEHGNKTAIKPFFDQVDRLLTRLDALVKRIEAAPPAPKKVVHFSHDAKVFKGSNAEKESLQQVQKYLVKVVGSVATKGSPPLKSTTADYDIRVTQQVLQTKEGIKVMVARELHKDNNLTMELLLSHPEYVGERTIGFFYSLPHDDLLTWARIIVQQFVHAATEEQYEIGMDIRNSKDKNKLTADHVEALMLMCKEEGIRSYNKTGLDVKISDRQSAALKERLPAIDQKIGAMDQQHYREMLMATRHPRHGG